MGAIITTFFTLLLILVSLFLILVVLMQRANTNAGLGTAFGGGIAESTFGAETGNILTRSTVGASIAFFIISFGLYLGHMASLGHSTSKDAILPEVEQETPIVETMPTTSAAGETESIFDVGGLGAAGDSLSPAIQGLFSDETGIPDDDLDSSAADSVGDSQGMANDGSARPSSLGGSAEDASESAESP